MCRSAPIRVLLVDDDCSLSRLVREKLELTGYLVDLAHNGEEGLASYARGRHDVVIVDQTMPCCSGLEMVRVLASRGRLPATIMVTGTGDEGLAVQAMKLGINEYLVKDMAGGFLKYLPAAIERALDQQCLIQTKQRAEEALAQRLEELKEANQALRREVAQRKTAERALRDSQESLQTIIDAVPESLMVVDRQYHVVLANLIARNLAGGEELVPRSLACLRVPQGSGVADGGRMGSCPLDQVVASRAPLTVERVCCDALGNETSVEVSVAPVFGERGEVVQIVGLCRDVTQRKRLERELAQAHRLESVGQLAAGIAHEINTPIQYIGDNTRFLGEALCTLEELLGVYDRLLRAAKEGTVTDAIVAEVEFAVRRFDAKYLRQEAPQAIQQSLEGVDRVATIVRAMKEFAHPAAEEKQPIDLNRAIENTLTVSSNEWKYVAELEIDLDPTLPLVPCLLGGIRQVVLNLVLNAAQAITSVTADKPSEAKGTITVSTRRDGDSVEIRVQDTGGGIPREIQSRIFDPFFTTKDVGKGTGQGLAVAYSIVVEKHGGSIDFETEPGKGTTFTVRLPIVGSPTDKTDLQPEEAVQAAC